MIARRALAGLLLAAPALAQQGRAMRVIVPFPPGGTGDVLGRLAARELEAGLGQAVVVENRPGGGGAIGAEALARAAADGQTLGLSNIAGHAIGPAVTPPPYDPLRDFTHLALVAAVPSAIAVAATSPHATLAQLLAAARANPGGVRFGSNGNGTSSHAKLEILKRAAGVDITHVPYRGSAQASVDVIGGQIEGLIAAVPDIGRNERLRLLAITTEARAPRWPDVPSVAELGFPALVASNWFGISGPAGIPAAAADRVNAVLVAALNRADLAERLRELGAEPNRLSRTDYTGLVSTDLARWRQVVREAGIRAD